MHKNWNAPSLGLTSGFRKEFPFAISCGLCWRERSWVNPSRILFCFRPREDARFCAVCPLESFSRPGVFNILDRPVHPGATKIWPESIVCPIDSSL